jgi:signal transduction histidine kinase
MRERFFGSLVACSVSGRRFEPQQVELLMGIAHQLAVAQDAVEQYDRQRHEAEVSSALARVGQQLMAALGTAAFLDRLCHVTAEVLRGSASHTLLRQADEDVYVPVASYGATPEAQAIARAIKIPRQMMDGVLAELEHADVSEVRTIPLDLLSSAEQERLGFGITLGMALRRGPTLIGLQVVQSRNRTEPFRPIDLRIARGIAQIASVALEHARVVEELNQASRLKSEFVATMSHELRTPINIILGYADLLLGGEFGPLTPDQTAALRQTNRSAGELLELINATLDLGRFEAGQVPLAVQDVDLTDLFREVRAETRRLGGAQTCQVLWTALPDLPPLSTDFVKLKTVLKNLVNNALKFTEQGSVTVSVEGADDGVMFSVADTGIGIAPDVLPVIFEAFRQADSSTTRRYGGVGLGLYIVRRFVALLGGRVTVESTLGQGSTFRVWVPLRTPASRVAA